MKFEEWAGCVRTKIQLTGANNAKALLVLSDSRVVPEPNLQFLVEDSLSVKEALQRIEAKVLLACNIGKLVAQRWRAMERPRDGNVESFIRTVWSDVKKLWTSGVEHVYTAYQVVMAAIIKLPGNVGAPFLAELEDNLSGLDNVVTKMEAALLMQAQHQRALRDAGLTDSKDRKDTKRDKKKQTINEAAASDGGNGGSKASKDSHGRALKKDFPCMLESCTAQHVEPLDCEKVMALDMEEWRMP